MTLKQLKKRLNTKMENHKFVIEEVSKHRGMKRAAATLWTSLGRVEEEQNQVIAMINELSEDYDPDL